MTTPAAPDDDGPVVVVTGNPIDGFTFYGPAWPDTREIEHLTDRTLAGEFWWYAPLLPLPGSRTATGDDVRGCSCGMADYGAPGHDGGPPAPTDTISTDPKGGPS